MGFKLNAYLVISEQKNEYLCVKEILVILGSLLLKETADG